eukprot:10089939-Alexandrium_andersonii.AAC.1
MPQYAVPSVPAEIAYFKARALQVSSADGQDQEAGHVGFAMSSWAHGARVTLEARQCIKGCMRPGVHARAKSRQRHKAATAATSMMDKAMAATRVLAGCCCATVLVQLGWALPRL